MTSFDVKQDDRAHQRVEAMPAVEARQGLISGRVLTVLLCSVFLAAVALGVAWLIFGR